MTGFERLKSMVKDQEDVALKQTVEYLLTKSYLEKKFLNEEKDLDGMCGFIRNKVNGHYKNGWTYIPDEVVFSLAVMYFSLPNSILKINDSKEIKKGKNNNASVNKTNDNNKVIDIEKAKENIDQISLFGGDNE